MSSQTMLDHANLLQAKTIGFECSAVNPKFFAKNSGFDRWYRSPHDFDLFCWSESTVIVRAEIRMDQYMVYWSGKSVQIDRIENIDEENFGLVQYSDLQFERFSKMAPALVLATIVDAIECEPGYFLPLISALLEDSDPFVVRSIKHVAPEITQ